MEGIRCNGRNDKEFMWFEMDGDSVTGTTRRGPYEMGEGGHRHPELS